MDIKYPLPDGRLWSFFVWNDIPSKVHHGKVYLRRLRVVGTPWFSVFVHWIEEPDTDQDPHDHPWNFYSLIWRGGYWEEVWKSPDTLSVSPRGHVRARVKHTWVKTPITTAHQITDVDKNTVTVVFTGKRTREWGFWPRSGYTRKFVPRKEYLNGEYVLDEFA